MKKVLRLVSGVWILAIASWILSASSVQSSADATGPSVKEIERDLQRLCSKEFAGRGLGSPGLELAADYLETRLREIGLRPGLDSGYRQDFAGPSKEPLCNLIARIGSGGDGPYMIVGAHYDHLGVAPDGAVYYGADDNASGVAAVLEIARKLAADPPDGRVLLILFSGEESGLLGSRYYCSHPALPLQSCVAMVNLDTVGRLREGGLIIFGSDTAREWKSILSGVDYGFHLSPKFPADDPGGSDQVSFVEKDVPSLQLFTGANADYHRPSDTLDKVDREGVAKIAAYTAELCLFLAEEGHPLSFVEPGKKTPPPSGGRRRVSVGTIPDFNHSGRGVLLAGVIPGSPAQKAGLAKGDLLLEVDDTPVDDLAAYAAVLKEHSPGDEIPLVFERAGTRHRVLVVLAERR